MTFGQIIQSLKTFRNDLKKLVRGLTEIEIMYVKCLAHCLLLRKHSICVSIVFIVILLKGSNKYMFLPDGSREYLWERDGSRKSAEEGRKEAFVIYSF